MTRVNIRHLGLEQYLNSTRSLHNGLGYTDFVRYITQGDEFGERMTKARIYRRFNISKPTFDHWLGIYNEEQLKK